VIGNTLGGTLTDTETPNFGTRMILPPRKPEKNVVISFISSYMLSGNRAKHRQ